MFLLAYGAQSCDQAAVTAAAKCMQGLTIPSMTSKDDVCKYVQDYLACYPGDCCTATTESALFAYSSIGCDNLKCGSSTATNAKMSVAFLLVLVVSLLKF